MENVLWNQTLHQEVYPSIHEEFNEGVNPSIHMGFKIGWRAHEKKDSDTWYVFEKSKSIAH